LWVQDALPPHHLEKVVSAAVLLQEDGGLALREGGILVGEADVGYQGQEDQEGDKDPVG
jgi:hypothetical protein